MYRDEKGVDTDRNKAYLLFERSSRHGHVFARKDLAVLLMKGQRGASGIVKGLILFITAVIDTIKIAWRSEDDERLRH